VNPTLAITTGDPAGIGPEIAVKCLSDLDVLSTCRLVVVGNAGQIRRTGAALHSPLPQSVQVWDGKGALNGAGPFLLDTANVGTEVPPGKPTAESGRAAMAAIRKAVALAWEKRVAALVTGPISKKALHLAGFEATGHTEILARLTDSPQVGMMFVTPSFKVAILSTHLPLREALDGGDVASFQLRLKHVSDDEIRRAVDTLRPAGIASKGKLKKTTRPELSTPERGYRSREVGVLVRRSAGPRREG